MARGPGRRQPATDALESTTVMPSVSVASMQNAGRRAATLVDAAVHARDVTPPAGRKVSRKTVDEASPVAPSVDGASPVDAQPGMEPDAPVPRNLTDAARETIGSVEQATQHDLDAGATVAESVHRTIDTARHEMIQAAGDASQDAEAAIEAAGAQAEVAAAAMSETVVEAMAASQDAAVTLADLNAKIAEAMRSTAEANMSFLTSLFGVRSLAQAADLNQHHLRRQMSALASQSRELTALAHKFAIDAMGTFAGRDGGRRT